MAALDRLFVSDLDGTLLDPNARLSEYTRTELHRLLEAGLPFTIASARSIVSIKAILTGLPMTLPVIEFNGAYITDLATGHHQFCRSIGSEIVCSVIERAISLNLPPFISASANDDDRLYYHRTTNGGMEWYVDERVALQDARLRQVSDLHCCLDDRVVCMTLIGTREQLSPLQAWIAEAFGEQIALNFYENAYSPPWHWLTVHDRRATKDRALQVLAEDYGVPLGKVTVFGDAGNDLSMFEVAGTRVAVANADPKLRSLADVIIGPHHEDSVVKYLASQHP